VGLEDEGHLDRLAVDADPLDEEAQQLSPFRRDKRRPHRLELGERELGHLLGDGGIRWSARWDSQSWRISLRQDGTWRATRTVRSPRGDTQIHTQTWPTPEPAWAWIRDAWLAETTASYHHCEQALLAGIRQLRAGSPGFRPGSPLLRTRAEAARDRLYAQARWAENP
jgi:hypothetical protein